MSLLSMYIVGVELHMISMKTLHEFKDCVFMLVEGENGWLSVCWDWTGVCL